MAEFTLSTGKLQAPGASGGLRAATISPGAASSGVGQINIPVTAGQVQFTPTQIPKAVESQVLPGMLSFGDTLMRSVMQYQQREAEFLATEASLEFSELARKSYDGTTNEKGDFVPGYSSITGKATAPGYDVYEAQLDEHLSTIMDGMEPRVKQRAIIKLQSTKNQYLTKAANHRSTQIAKAQEDQRYVAATEIMSQISGDFGLIYKVNPNTGLTKKQEFYKQFLTVEAGDKAWSEGLVTAVEFNYLSAITKPVNSEAERLANLQSAAAHAALFVGTIGQSELEDFPEQLSDMLSNLNKWESDSKRAAVQAYDLNIRRADREQKLNYEAANRFIAVMQAKNDGLGEKIRPESISMLVEGRYMDPKVGATYLKNNYGIQAVQAQQEVEVTVLDLQNKELTNEQLAHRVQFNNLDPGLARQLRSDNNNENAKLSVGNELLIIDIAKNKMRPLYELNSQLIAGDIDIERYGVAIKHWYGQDAVFSETEKQMFLAASNGTPWPKETVETAIRSDNVSLEFGEKYIDKHHRDGVQEQTERQLFADLQDGKLTDAQGIKRLVMAKELSLKAGEKYVKDNLSEEIIWSKTETAMLTASVMGEPWDLKKVRDEVAAGNLDPKIGAEHLAAIYEIKVAEAEAQILGNAVEGKLLPRKEFASRIRDQDVGGTFGSKIYNDFYEQDAIRPSQDIINEINAKTSELAKDNFKDKDGNSTLWHFYSWDEPISNEMIRIATEHQEYLQDTLYKERQKVGDEWIEMWTEGERWQKGIAPEKLKFARLSAESELATQLKMMGDRDFNQIMTEINLKYHPLRREIKEFTEPMIGGHKPASSAEAQKNIDRVEALIATGTLTSSQEKQEREKAQRYAELWKDLLEEELAIKKYGYLHVR